MVEIFMPGQRMTKLIFEQIFQQNTIVNFLDKNLRYETF